MIIQKNGNLFGLGESFHLRKIDGGLRVDRTTIPVDDVDDAYEKVKAAAAKGQKYVDLDPKPEPEKKATPKKAPANKPAGDKVDTSAGDMASAG